MIRFPRLNAVNFVATSTFRCAIRLRRHFHGSGQRVLSRLFEGFVRWFGPVFACLGRVFQSFCLMTRAKIKGHNRASNHHKGSGTSDRPAMRSANQMGSTIAAMKRPSTPKAMAGRGRSVHPINESVKTRARIAKFVANWVNAACCRTWHDS